MWQAIVIECPTMTKRRLNQQQLRRIQSQQQNRRQSSADGDAADSANPMLGPEQRGRVVCHYGQQLDIEALDGEQAGELFRCYQRSNLPPLVTCDEVVWQPDGDTNGVVLARAQRRTVMSRPDNRGELRAIAV